MKTPLVSTCILVGVICSFGFANLRNDDNRPVRFTSAHCASVYSDGDEEALTEVGTLRSYNNPSNATSISIGSTYFSNYQNSSTPVVFSLYSSQVQVICLNYNGVASAFRLYKINHYTTSSALMSFADVTTSNFLLPLDENVTYYLEFQSLVSGTSSFSIAPCIVSETLQDIDQYVVHLTKAPLSDFGSTISIEKIALSTSSSTETASNLPSYYLPIYEDVLSSTLNFGYDINLDTRQVVANGGLFSHHSAIAYVRSEVLYPRAGQSDQGYIVFSSASFLSENIVMTCAHTFLNYAKIDNTAACRSSLSMKNFKFYPGASNYQNADPSDFHGIFGTFSGVEAYLPLSFVFAHSSGSSFLPEENDWAICITEETEEGSYSHSWLGLKVPDQTSYSNARSMGYPGLEVYPGSTNNRVWMWTTIPLNNSIYTDANKTNLFDGNTLYTNGGASGSPLFFQQTVFDAGYPVTSVKQIGVLSGCVFGPQTTPTTFYYSYYPKICHYSVNLFSYLEGLANE